MAKRARRNHAPAFKAKVALAALKGEKLAREFGLEPLQVARELVPDGNVVTASVVMNERGG